MGKVHGSVSSLRSNLCIIAVARAVPSPLGSNEPNFSRRSEIERIFANLERKSGNFGR